MPKKPTPSQPSKYFSENSFRRLMLLIDTVLQYPGVGYLNKLENIDEHHNALEEVRTYLLRVAKQRNVTLECSIHTLQKDLAFLRSLGILGDQMYRWGYYLGTGAMSEAELTIALNALYSQAQYQRDPLVQELYNKLARRLKGLASKDQLFYPVRAQLNRSIVETNPAERAAKMLGQRNLFDCLESVESAILKGHKIELARKPDPIPGREYGTYLYPGETTFGLPSG